MAASKRARVEASRRAAIHRPPQRDARRRSSPSQRLAPLKTSIAPLRYAHEEGSKLLLEVVSQADRVHRDSRLVPGAQFVDPFRNDRVEPVRITSVGRPVRKQKDG